MIAAIDLLFGCLIWVLRFYIIWLLGQAYGIPIKWDAIFCITTIMFIFNTNAVWTRVNLEDMMPKYDAFKDMISDLFVDMMRPGHKPADMLAIVSDTNKRIEKAKEARQKGRAGEKLFSTLFLLGIMFAIRFAIDFGWFA